MSHGSTSRTRIAAALVATGLMSFASAPAHAERVIPTYGDTIAPIAWFAGASCGFGFYGTNGCVNIKQGPFDTLGRDTLIFEAPRSGNAIGLMLSVDTWGSDVAVSFYRDDLPVGGSGFYFAPPRDPLTGMYSLSVPETVFTSFLFDEARFTARRMAVLNRPFSVNDVVFGMAVVPEPDTHALLLVGLGLFSLAAMRPRLRGKA